MTNMSFKLEDFVPQASNWFDTKLIYKGQGRAEFTNPVGYIEGMAKVTVGENGDCRAELKVEHFHTDSVFESRKENLYYLVTGIKPDKSLGWTTYHIGGSIHNRCSKLTVHTDNGVFQTLKEFSYTSGNFNSISGTGKLDFDIPWSQFDIKSDSVVKSHYWVLPLTNFLSECTWRQFALHDHPLRIYPIKNLPADTLATNDRAAAIHNATSQNHIIIFKSEGKFGFIERLPDYKKRVERLTAWKTRECTTAVMVGNIGGNSMNFEDLEGWVPFDFLPLIELATGLEVSIPWIEFRDKDGKLVRRIHEARGTPYFYKKRPALHKIIPTEEIGRLLTRFAASPHSHNRMFRGAVRQLARNGFGSRNIEETIGYVCRGLDELCDYFGIQKNIGFGARVVNLLKLSSFSFPDADIINNHYKANPRPDGKTWQEVVREYRNVTAHDNYFDISDPIYVPKDIIRITAHLHDILLRLILKAIDYDGKYVPIVSSYYDETDVDWVSSTTTAQELGY
jgi:hypothetical protein